MPGWSAHSAVRGPVPGAAGGTAPVAARSTSSIALVRRSSGSPAGARTWSARGPPPCLVSERERLSGRPWRRPARIRGRPPPRRPRRIARDGVRQVRRRGELREEPRAGRSAIAQDGAVSGQHQRRAARRTDAGSPAVGLTGGRRASSRRLWIGSSAHNACAAPERSRPAMTWASMYPSCLAADDVPVRRVAADSAP